MRWSAYSHAAAVPGYAMYSSLVDGIVTDPSLMIVPVDDHLVHRGDGIFETVKTVDGAVYNLEAHLHRLALSAFGIGLTLPCDHDTLRSIILETVRAGDRLDAQIRVLISRGPGSMGVNPYDCPHAQLYVVAAPLTPPFMQSHPDGARIGFSSVPVKPPPFAGIKSCNYLPNALMAKEARDRHLHFVVGVGPDGQVTEGPTENILLISPDHELLTPDTPDVLPGTTLDRVMHLAEGLKRDKRLTAIRHATVHREDLLQAREIFIAGTTHNLVAVSQIEDVILDTGPPGPVYTDLSARLIEDVHTNESLRTPVLDTENRR